MNKWFNKQKPTTLAYITALSCFVLTFLMSYFTENVFTLEAVFKFSFAVFCFTFFLSWMMFYQGERSGKIFDEIDELQNRAKKIKTKTELIILESDYRLLRKRADNQGHYSRLNFIKGIIDTKKEYL